MTSADFRILGPLEVWLGGVRLRLGGRRQAKVLAALLVEAGRVVSLPRLVDAVWDADPPATARHQVQDLATRLRRALVAGGMAPEVLRTEGGGYLLDIPADALDACRFTRQVSAARGLAGPPAVAALRAALALWRGPALAGIGSRALSAAAAGWDERRLAVWEDCLAGELELGRPADVVGELAELAERHPYRERLVGLTMLALYRAGRRPDALAAYRRLADRLREELGLDPSAELGTLHERILRGDAGLSARTGSATVLAPPAVPDPGVAPGPPAVPGPRTEMALPAESGTPAAEGPRAGAAPAPEPSPTAGPAQLPADVPAFIGRTAELARLDELAGLDDVARLDDLGTAGPAVAVAVLTGPAGVGKTTLAVHWAQRVREAFPDGQLYLNLRGFDPGGSAVRPAEAVRGFLDALGVSPERVPGGLDAQVGLYRSLLAGRRMLVVLDNARDADQVRPLLPGSPACLVLVTSREQLAGLVVAAGAYPVQLDLLSAADARQLLTRRLGRRRVAAEPQAVEEIIARCARLPLALAVVAGRAATHPGFGLTALAGELRQAQGGLDAFAGGDPATDVRSVFSWSYHARSAAAARLFRLLAVHPGPDIGIAAVASLAGVAVPEVRPVLAELARAHLVGERVPGRYAFHDLLRAYAAELAGALDTEADRRAARHRVFDHYLHCAHAADRLLYPHRDPLALGPPQPAVTLEQHAGADAAAAWFAAEHHVLLAAIEQAAATGFDAHTWQLAWTLQTFAERRGHWAEAATCWRTVLATADHGQDQSGRARAHRNVASAEAAQGHFEDARAHYRHALELYRELGDVTGQAHTQQGLTEVCDQQGRHVEALDHARQALALYRAAGDRRGEAYSVSTVGWCHAQLGNQQQAITVCHQAMDLLRKQGDRWGEAATWDSLGYAHHGLGRHAEATACYRHAADLLRDLGDRHREAVALTHLGDAEQAAGDSDAAREAWRQALDILDELGHPDAGPVRAKLYPHPRPLASTAT